MGSLLLSVIHAAIPNHWIPLVSISEERGWNQRETLGVTAITGFSHTASTISIGIAVGLFGYTLSSNYETFTRYLAPTLLLLIGFIYLFLDYRENSSHSHSHGVNGEKVSSKKSKYGIVLTLAIAMFFSPCLQIEAYYLTAGSYGWMAIWAVSIIYLIVTVLGMILLVFLGKKGVQKLEWHFLAHNEKRITGLILIFLGILDLIVSI